MENQRISSRDLTLDVLKSLGIIAVILPHHLSWLFIDYQTGSLRHPESHKLFYLFYAGIAFLILQLPTVAGTAFFLSVHKKSLTFKHVFLRAIALIAACFLLNAATWGMTWPQDIFDWDILGFIGLSMIISFPFIRTFSRRINQYMLACAGSTAIFLSGKFPLLRFSDAYWHKIIIGDPAGENYWPLCPWFSLFVLGIFLGKFLLSEKEVSRRCLIICSFLTIFVTVWDFIGPLSFLKGLPQHFQDLWGNFLFKPYLHTAIAMLIINLTLFLFIKKSLDHYMPLKNFFVRSGILYYGQGIFWVYLTTYITGYHFTQWTIKHVPMTFPQSVLALLILLPINLVIGFATGRLACRNKMIHYS